MGLEEQFMGLSPVRTTSASTTPARKLSAAEITRNTARFMRETGMVVGEPPQPALKTKGPGRPATQAQIEGFMLANGMV